ncbi:uncharacterized protein MYCFIDRAFT_196667 [Pseudocercospora fijiensis CIRAD86]|uniref:Uncharacterized protein n=1 Tax=Pseudocercospora fijiensis (strain CIRAD86) TaxID=383855 RepID=M2ZWJ6_PSEFD|nr:uncharacterized protein MYCFIDRAFT_196667 [Pseudocercospora fijiensis CIRAD86]EME83369.1 hypothetical protein MYCFIDRAFT_196667 [Pseudocercospora fijiensis CIRAD86]
MNEELSQQDIEQRINTFDADTMQEENAELPDSQSENVATNYNMADLTPSQSDITQEADPFVLPELLIYGSFLNYEQILSIPFEDIPLADIDDIMRTVAQYTIKDIVQHVNRNNVDNATVVLTDKIVQKLITRSIKRLAKSRATTVDKVKKEFEAKQKENGIVRGKYVSDAQPDVVFHPSGVDGNF